MPDRYAVIAADKIENVILWDGTTPYTPPEGRTLVQLSTLPDGAWIGWTKSGETWAPPAPPTD